MWQDAVAIMPGETAADLALYHSHHKELIDLAESTSSAEDFKQRAGAWLYQRRTLDDFAEPAKKSSERARAVADVNAAGDDGGVNGDSSVDSDLQEKERLFRESIVQDYPDLCSDTLPEDGTSATWPDGRAYEVHLDLKEGCVPDKRNDAARAGEDN